MRGAFPGRAGCRYFLLLVISPLLWRLGSNARIRWVEKEAEMLHQDLLGFPLILAKLQRWAFLNELIISFWLWPSTCKTPAIAPCLWFQWSCIQSKFIPSKYEEQEFPICSKFLFLFYYQRKYLSGCLPLHHTQHTPGPRNYNQLNCDIF